MKILIFPVIACLAFATPCGSYVYPLFAAKNREDAVAVSQIILNDLVVPLRDGLCGVCVHFLRVYECLVDGQYYRDERGPMLVDHILDFFGWSTESKDRRPNCSYFSVAVVTFSTALFVAIVVASKKLIEHVGDDHEWICPQVFRDYRNCVCFKRD
ncbi:uncharacterized protein LOC132697858 [Cylas formicarius]|uniref:uncharacterized protein LOC132697858 n=1 Tax=Cylas formicarius TaxID=197179 RepID=UPI0029583224|nr:uncharacterized protein LOC132697858 [Cylas formicarius]